MKNHRTMISEIARPLAAERDWKREAMESVAMAGLIAVCAQISIPLPFTDVPFTLQVFAVLLAGGLLGAPWGAVSVMEYLALGAMGAPVFAQHLAGPAVLLGPTGGYLMGFVVAAALIGWVANRSRHSFSIGIAMAAGVVTILACGGLWRHFALGHSLVAVFGLAVVPFLAADLAKALAAWAIVTKWVRR